MNNNTIEKTTLKGFLTALGFITLLVVGIKILFTFPLQVLFFTVVVAPLMVLGFYLVKRVSNNNSHYTSIE